MKHKVTCLITGCALTTHLGTAWGDLHDVAGAFIFNAIRNHTGETEWNAIVSDKNSRVFLEPDHDFFERRGLIIFAAENTTLNEAAIIHIERNRL